jgi:hypothetical protein
VRQGKVAQGSHKLRARRAWQTAQEVSRSRMPQHTPSQSTLQAFRDSGALKALVWDVPRLDLHDGARAECESNPVSTFEPLLDAKASPNKTDGHDDDGHYHDDRGDDDEDRATSRDVAISSYLGTACAPRAAAGDASRNRFRDDFSLPRDPSPNGGERGRGRDRASAHDEQTRDRETEHSPGGREKMKMYSLYRHTNLARVVSQNRATSDSYKGGEGDIDISEPRGLRRERRLRKSVEPLTRRHACEADRIDAQSKNGTTTKTHRSAKSQEATRDDFSRLVKDACSVSGPHFGKYFARAR